MTKTENKKTRIIFWLDSPGLYFGISYFLQKSYDCDMYALIDVTNRPKRFFQEQNIVNFQKTWFYHGHIKKGIKADEEYLRSFEKKYDINLWKLAINERIFYLYNYFHKFTSEEITINDSIYDQNDSGKIYNHIGTYKVSASSYYNNTLPRNWSLGVSASASRRSYLPLLLSQYLVDCSCYVISDAYISIQCRTNTVDCQCLW